MRFRVYNISGNGCTYCCGLSEALTLARAGHVVHVCVPVPEELERE
jgi:hypothetical protein